MKGHLPPSAIYAFTPTDESGALVATQRLRVRPISPFVIPVGHQLAPPAGPGDDDDNDV